MGINQPVIAKACSSDVCSHKHILSRGLLRASGVFWVEHVIYVLSSNYALISVSTAAHNEVVSLRNLFPHSPAAAAY